MADQSNSMQAIALRLPRDLLEKLKLIAAIRGEKYQTMMRGALRVEGDQMAMNLLRKAAEKKGQKHG
jgi:predicted DNA binding CopG/RHH family protein